VIPRVLHKSLYGLRSRSKLYLKLGGVDLICIISLCLDGPALLYSWMGGRGAAFDLLVALGAYY